MSKDATVFESLGSVDELSSFLGLAAASLSAGSPLLMGVVRAQRALFEAGAHIGTSQETDFARVDERVEEMEREMDRMNSEMPPMANFVLLGGGESAARLHVCRSVCRRAERCVVASVKAGECAPGVLKFLNRLADWLFVAARMAAHCNGFGDTPAKLVPKE